MGTSKATTLVTGPTKEPLSLDEVKEHLRIESNDYDSELDALIQEARRYVERHTGKALITQTWNLVLDDFRIKLDIPYPPLQSIESVTYNDLDNTSQILNSAYYTVDTDSEPGRMNEAYGYSYPGVYPDLNSVTIQFKAGYGDDPEDVPETYKRAMKLYIQWMYDGEKLAKNALDSIITESKVNWF